MPKPVCVKCQRFYRPKKNGYSFVEGMPKYNGAPPGTIEPDSWQPYKLWHADLWQCQGCGHEIVVGAGCDPIAEHYQPDFAKAVTVFGATLQVNDC